MKENVLPLANLFIKSIYVKQLNLDHLNLPKMLFCAIFVSVTDSRIQTEKGG